MKQVYVMWENSREGEGRGITEGGGGVTRREGGEHKRKTSIGEREEDQKMRRGKESERRKEN